MNDVEEKTKTTTAPRRRRPSPSLFWPLVLIAAGVYFLLQNLGIAPTLNWATALSLWPLVLILIGLNLVVRQAPRPLGTLLSLLVGIVAVGAFGYVLLTDAETLSARFGLPRTGQVIREEIAWAADVASVTATIDFHVPGGEMSALSDSADLIAGTVSYTDRLIFTRDVQGDEAVIRLDTEGTGGVFFGPMITNYSQADRWRIGLSPNVPLDLRVDVGSGPVTLRLEGLELTDLVVDGGSGRTEIALPAGSYDANLDVSSGAVGLTLPAGGAQNLVIDGGSGALTIRLPAGMAARVELDPGSGAFRPDARFSQVSAGENNEIWETEGYATAAERVDLTIDQGSGAIRIEAP